MDPQTYGLTQKRELRDYYTEANVFWVPERARWEGLRDVAKLPTGAALPWGGKMKGVAFLLDDALAALGEENERLKGDPRPRRLHPPCRLTFSTRACHHGGKGITPRP